MSPDDVVIRKSRASVFFQTELDDVIRDQGIDSIVVGGESTSGCVRASVVDAYSRGLPPVLVEDCVFDRNPISHAINLFDMHHKYGHVTSLDNVTQLIESSAGEQP
jgi:maleamate amidohydrolase